MPMTSTLTDREGTEGSLSIDVHTHVVPSDMGNVAFAGAPRLRSDGDDHVVEIQDRPFRRVSPRAWDLDLRRADMDRDRVAMQILSPMPDLYSYWAPADAASDLCRTVNTWISNQARTDPLRFVGLGMLPMQDPDLAAGMVTEIAAAGLAGVAIGSNVEGQPLYTGLFTEVFAELEAHGLMVFVHAYRPPARTTLSRPLDANACTFPADVGLALSGLVAEGQVHHWPDLRWLFSHGGGSALASLPRLAHLRSVTGSEQPPIGGDLHRIWVDLLVYEPTLLHAAIAVYGATQVVVGSDYPFLPDRPGELADRTPGLTDEQLAALRHGNARALLHRDTVTHPGEENLHATP